MLEHSWSFMNYFACVCNEPSTVTRGTGMCVCVCCASVYICFHDGYRVLRYIPCISFLSIAHSDSVRHVSVCMLLCMNVSASTSIAQLKLSILTLNKHKLFIRRYYGNDWAIYTHRCVRADDGCVPRCEQESFKGWIFLMNGFLLFSQCQFLFGLMQLDVSVYILLPLLLLLDIKMVLSQRLQS